MKVQQCFIQKITSASSGIFEKEVQPKIQKVSLHLIVAELSFFLIETMTRNIFWEAVQIVFHEKIHCNVLCSEYIYLFF